MTRPVLNARIIPDDPQERLALALTRAKRILQRDDLNLGSTRGLLALALVETAEENERLRPPKPPAS